MPEIHEVFTVTKTADDALIVDVDFTGVSGDRMRTDYILRHGDEHGAAPMIRQWLEDNVPEELPYIPLSPLSEEELREQMPDKTPREFRDILTDMGIFPYMVTAKITEIPFDIERQKALNAWEVPTSIRRVDPYVDMIGAFFNKSPNEIDAAWEAP
ncbi:hypothetical protein P8H26_13790 [Pseudochrobactrum sp. sp1633]|uniref:hypothetical protein n=1 Tax=Pseudochrobactrum sp. sp1633 TaxID=3036706 RepID=UPI0025A503EF|nr:hypothetical protein [Pseudochrobactrum sp. sp1633]MDM8346466.1 hypothetical protein [Pseudochrobactrum sp. sp1633]